MISIVGALRKYRLFGFCPWLYIILVAAICLSGTANPVHASGGVVIGTTTLLYSGSPADKIDVVFIGDGFKENQQGKFNTRVDEAVEEFLSAHPLQTLRSAFNIHRINIASPQSGTDTYSRCGGEDTGKDNRSRTTALDTGYCAAGSGDVERCILSSDPDYIETVVGNNVPGYDLIYVLVNDTGHGGCKSRGQIPIAYSTIEDDFEEAVIHEMGHLIFGLGDEYDSDDTQTISPSANAQRTEPNLSYVADRSVKWNDLIASSTDVPTYEKSDCDDRDVDYDAEIDQVGTYEGAASKIYLRDLSCASRKQDEVF
jgi:hypothetical protein